MWEWEIEKTQIIIIIIIIIISTLIFFKTHGAFKKYQGLSCIYQDKNKQWMKQIFIRILSVPVCFLLVQAPLRFHFFKRSIIFLVMTPTFSNLIAESGECGECCTFYSKYFVKKYQKWFS